MARILSTPALNFNGVVTVSYQVCDATLCDTATLTITVNPINDAPIAADDNISTDEETPAAERSQQMTAI